MKIKRIAALLLTLPIAVFMFACAKDGETKSAAEDDSSTVSAKSAVPFNAVPGEKINAGNISAICPEGWFNIPKFDIFASEGTPDVNKLVFNKGTDDNYSNLPFISITFYGKDNVPMSYESQMEYYDTAVALEPFMIKDQIWEGFTYKVGENVEEAVISIVGNGEFNVLVRLKGEGETITLSDADVQTILSSIA